MPEPQQVTSKTVLPPDPLTSDLEDLQQYAVSLFVEKLAISLGFAILSALIVFITALIYDVRFLTACFRAVIAFFVSGVAAALVSNVLDMQEDYYKMKGEVAASAQVLSEAPQATSEETTSDDSEQTNNADTFKPLDGNSLPNVNNKT